MVSRYRDIIETNQTSLSRQTSFMSTTTGLRNGLDLIYLISIKFLFLGSTTDVNIDTSSMNGLSSIVAPITNNQV